MDFAAVTVSTFLMFACRGGLTWKLMERDADLRNSYNVKIFTTETTSEVKKQFRLGLNQMLMGVWSWWSFDLFTFISAYLSVQEISAQMIFRAVGLLTFMIPCGLQIACQQLLSESIAKGYHTTIKQQFKLNLYIALGTGLVLDLILFAFQGTIQEMFTSSERVTISLDHTWFVFSVFVICESMYTVAFATVKAAGDQKKGALLCFVSYWVIGMPVSWLLVYKAELSISGIWIGLALACALNTAACVYIFSKTNWTEVCKSFAKQMEERRRE
jgi:MATE family multidrug resistance protein